MSEKPILFSGEMVRSILTGKKTVTRRVLKKNMKAPYLCGDTLYVRETWSRNWAVNGKWYYWYRADYPDGLPELWSWEDRWRPSIHMPKDAARIFLKVKDVRTEWLQDITAAEARKEGVGSSEEFRSLWERLNGTGSWDINPLVWVIEFEKIEH